MKSMIFAIALAGFTLMAGGVQAADHDIKPSWTSAADNMTYALTQLCLPYVLDGKDTDPLRKGQPLVQIDGWTSPVFTSLGVEAVRVGFAGFVHIGLGEHNGRRECDITAAGADPVALRKAMMAALATRSDTAFTPTVSHYLPGQAWEAEDMLCGDRAHPGAFVLASWSPKADADKIAAIITLYEGPRDPACDVPGVKKNYRTLVP